MRKSRRLCETNGNIVGKSRRLCDIISGAVGGGGYKVGTVHGYCSQRQALVIVVDKYVSFTIVIVSIIVKPKIQI